MRNVFNARYKKQNVERMKQNFFSKNYKKILSQNLLLAPILVPIMAIRKIYWHLENSKLHTLHFHNLTQKPLFMPYFALLYVCKKILKILNAIFDIIPKMIVNIRLLRGKVDIPYFELVLTTKCSLRCESCNNLMQYFDSKNAYTCSLQGIIDAVSAILDKIDCVRNVRIIGGEPLLFKDIAKVVEFLDSKKKVRSFDIVTNGSIVPKNDLLLALAKSNKSSITISDYSASPNIKIPLHYDKIIDLLKSHNIPHSILWQDKTEWINPQKIYKRGRSKGEIIRNFKACLMPCVSVMSNEMGVAFSKNQIVKNQIGGGR
ncbi:radical SAM protein [Helicobacter sp. 23-1044]